MLLAPQISYQGISNAAFGGDPHWANVVFLAGFESGLTDESGSPKTVSSTWTANPRASGGRFGSWRCDYGAVLQQAASAVDSADWDFGSSPFTLETWAFWNSVGSSFEYLLTHYDTGATQRSWALIRSGGNICMFLSSDGGPATTVASSAWTPTPSTWYHVAADFDGTDYRTYVDGVMKGKSVITPISLFASNARMGIGHALNSGAFNSAFDGGLDEIRITKGVARYASDSGFTPPAAAFPRS